MVASLLCTREVGHHAGPPQPVVMAESWLRLHPEESAELRDRCVPPQRDVPGSSCQGQRNRREQNPGGPLQSHQVCRDFYRNSFISCCQGHRLMSQSQLGSHQRRALSLALGLRAAWIPLGEPTKCQREGHCGSGGPHATKPHLCESQSLSPGRGHGHEGPSRPTVTTQQVRSVK